MKKDLLAFTGCFAVGLLPDASYQHDLVIIHKALSQLKNKDGRVLPAVVCFNQAAAILRRLKRKKG